MNRAQELLKVARQIERCRECKKGKTGKAVPGEGSPFAKVVFLGEAPGREESKEGRPFIGRSGKLLRTLIADTGLSEKEVFITSPVKYLPLSGTPSPSDIRHGLVHWEEQFRIISPKVLVLLGNSACRAFFGRPCKVLKERGHMMEKEGCTVFITLHPAAAIRFKKFMDPLGKDFQKLRRILLTKKIVRR